MLSLTMASAPLCYKFVQLEYISSIFASIWSPTTSSLQEKGLVALVFAPRLRATSATRMALQLPGPRAEGFCHSFAQVDLVRDPFTDRHQMAKAKCGFAAGSNSASSRQSAFELDTTGIRQRPNGCDEAGRRQERSVGILSRRPRLRPLSVRQQHGGSKPTCRGIGGKLASLQMHSGRNLGTG